MNKCQLKFEKLLRKLLEMRLGHLVQKGYEYNLIRFNEDLILEEKVNVLNDGFALRCNCFPFINECLEI